MAGKKRGDKERGKPRPWASQNLGPALVEQDVKPSTNQTVATRPLARSYLPPVSMVTRWEGQQWHGTVRKREFASLVRLISSHLISSHLAWTEPNWSGQSPLSGL